MHETKKIENFKNPGNLFSNYSKEKFYIMKNIK